MATYVYQCLKCNKEFEVQHSMTLDALTKCEELKNNCKDNGELQRIIQPTGIAFKGTGFYTTDYKKVDNKMKEISDKTKSPKASKIDFREM